jgi:hypothetical protein
MRRISASWRDECEARLGGTSPAKKFISWCPFGLRREQRQIITMSPHEKVNFGEDEEAACQLYAKFVAEDWELAEMGMEEFVRILEEEDNAERTEYKD